MIIYENTKTLFLKDVFDDKIADIILADMKSKLLRSTSRSEISSWTNSLGYMYKILDDHDIPDDAGIAIEYNIPHTSKRVDLIISGLDEHKDNTAVIIELKQWTEVEKVDDKEAIVRTFINGSKRECVHPSYQVWSYAQIINDFNQSVQDMEITLSPCACLHNYALTENDPITDHIYDYYLDYAPVFLKGDGNKLRDFIKKHIKFGDNKETLYLIDNGKIKPSKSLQDSLCSMMAGNPEFKLIDEQKTVYEEALFLADKCLKTDKKHVLIVEGGPGTGKSVLAINLLVSFTGKGMVAQYVSKNSAPRNVYSKKLKGTRRKTNIDNMFRSSGTYCSTEKNTFDALIVDEAHRLNEKSGMFQNQGENQIKEIINSSRLSVFFIDESQRVTIKDIGTIKEIEKYAYLSGAEIHRTLLESQFRCNGSDGYISWLDDVLEIRGTANFDSPDNGDYDFRVVTDPDVLRKLIEEKNEINNKSRIVAGYCWDWISSGKNKSEIHDINIDGSNFAMSWNLASSATWAIDEESVREAGCIHTCQGLEFDYVGVIIGNDLRYENGHLITDFTKRAKTDNSLKGIKSMYKKDPAEALLVAEQIIKNTYRTLMSRGQKGCFVYCVDKKLEEYLTMRSSDSDLNPQQTR